MFQAFKILILFHVLDSYPTLGGGGNKVSIHFRNNAQSNMMLALL